MLSRNKFLLFAHKYLHHQICTEYTLWMCACMRMYGLNIFIMYSAHRLHPLLQYQSKCELISLVRYSADGYRKKSQTEKDFIYLIQLHWAAQALSTTITIDFLNNFHYHLQWHGDGHFRDDFSIPYSSVWSIFSVCLVRCKFKMRPLFIRSSSLFIISIYSPCKQCKRKTTTFHIFYVSHDNVDSLDLWSFTNSHITLTRQDHILCWKYL